MNKTQSNKLASYLAAEAVLKANPEIASVSGLPAKVAMLSEKIAEINALAGTQTQPIEASTARRDQIFEAMAEMTLEIAGAVANVARDHAMHDLLQVVRVGRTAFRHLRRSHRIWIAQRVHDAALSVLDRLGVYGVTAESLASFLARITAAAEGVHMPRTTVVAKKAATEHLVSLFQATDALLRDEIDRLVIRLRKVQPEFYAGYRSARRIVDVRGRRAGNGETTIPPVVPATPANGSPPAAVATPPVNLAA